MPIEMSDELENWLKAKLTVQSTATKPLCAGIVPVNGAQVHHKKYVEKLLISQIA